jgi:hypothetical protein
MGSRPFYSVSIVQNPTATLEDDVAVTRRVIASRKGPVILVGHSAFAADVDPETASFKDVVFESNHAAG